MFLSETSHGLDLPRQLLALTNIHTNKLKVSMTIWPVPLFPDNSKQTANGQPPNNTPVNKPAVSVFFAIKVLSSVIILIILPKAIEY